VQTNVNVENSDYTTCGGDSLLKWCILNAEMW